MSSRVVIKKENQEIAAGRKYIGNFASYLYSEPTKLLSEPSDCLNQLFASWMHTAFRNSIENGFSIEESITAAIKNPVMDGLFTIEQLEAARTEADKKKALSLDQNNLTISKAIA